LLHTDRNGFALQLEKYLLAADQEDDREDADEELRAIIQNDVSENLQSLEAISMG